MALTTERTPISQFKAPRLSLVWRPTADTRASWRLGLVGFYFRETPRRLHIVFSARGLLLWTLALGLTAYVTLAASLHYVWSRSPHNRVTFLDLLLPTRWEQAKVKRGGDLVAQGIEDLRGGRFGTALLFLARGVSMAPADHRGRLELARLYLRAGYLHRAKQIMQDGLAHAPVVKAYSDLYFAVANYMEDHEAILAAVEKLRPGADARLLRDLAAQQAMALRQLECWEELDALRANLADAPLVAVEQTWARAQLDRGTPELALAAIEANPELFGLTGERADLESRLALAAGQLNRARAVATTWRSARPTDFGPRVLEVLIEIQDNFWFTAREKMEDYFVAYGSQPTLAAQLFIRVAELEDEQWLRTTRQFAIEAGAYGPQARMIFIEALMTRGHFAEADRELAAALPVMQAAKFNPGVWAQGVRRILDACRGTSPSARALLIDFLTSERSSPAGYHLALNSLAHSTAHETLADVHASAINRYPSLQPKPTTREAIAVATKAGPKPRPVITRREPTPLPPRSATDTASRTPPKTEQGSTPRPAIVLPQLLSEQQRKDEQTFPTERVARSGLVRTDQLILEGDGPAALEILAQIERAGHSSLRREILLRRVRIYGDRRQYDLLLSNTRLLLREPSLNQVQLRELAEAWRATGQTDSALILLRETTATFPAARWASDLQRSITEEIKIVIPDDPK